MAYADFNLQSSTSGSQSTVLSLPSHAAPNTVLQEDSIDPVRLARDAWTVKHAHVSDSSAIIDSIDVDMIDANQDSNSTEVYIVLDTNVLIHQLFVLKEALARIEAPSAELNVVMLVPGIVISELDYQKNGTRDIAIESRRASDWLAGEIGNGRGRVKGQAYTQTMLHTGDWRQRCGLTNDELILDCCKYFGHIKRKDVLLCTSDNNLAVQASSNAGNLFFRDVSAVIRPRRNDIWNAGQLLERAIPGFSQTSAASMHAFGGSKRRGGQRTEQTYSSYSSPIRSTPHVPIPQHPPTDDTVMEIDMDPQTSPHPIGDRRNSLHRQISVQLTHHLRQLTGHAARLQAHRRERESMHSQANTKYRKELPTEDDWSNAWSLRRCLTFVAKIPPRQPRSWTFGEGEASSLADFLGMPGERGARPGREWAKHDWVRELMKVKQLGQDFQVPELDATPMAEFEYEVMAVFAVD